MRERIAIMTTVEMATRFGDRLRPRIRRGGRRIRRRAITGGDEGDIDAPCWPQRGRYQLDMVNKILIPASLARSPRLEIRIACLRV
jgi:hypothetical protein